MNATTPDQRTEIIYALYNAWESATSEAGDISLCQLLRLPGTDTELIERLNIRYDAEPYVFSNFDADALQAEETAKYKKDLVEGSAWAKIAETYKMNAADMRHCRFMIEDDIEARVKDKSEKAKASKTIEVLEALIIELKDQTDDSRIDRLQEAGIE